MKDLLIQYFAGVLIVIALGTMLMIYTSPLWVILIITLLTCNFIVFLFRLKNLEKK